MTASWHIVHYTAIKLGGIIMGITADLAAFTAQIRLSDLPPHLVDRTKSLVLDLLGNIIRARHDAESTPPLLAAARVMGVAAGNTTVFGDSARYTPAGAALLNGALGHSLDFDDTHAAASLHPGCPVIPAALAAGEMTGASGADILAAIIAGYEVTCRIALALPAGDHYARGFHPTATCGVFGAAAAAARVFGLDPATIESAFGIALSQSAGSLQFLANGAWTKRFQVGWASMAGLSAAALAREGFKGAAVAFEGKHGFLNAYAPNPTPARAVQNLGHDWELLRTAVKPYPSCRYGHAGIDAAIEWHAQGLDPAIIERITYGTSRSGMTLIGDDLAHRQNPQNIVDGQFSGPFVIACGLLFGEMTWDSYAHLHDQTVRALLPRIAIEPDTDAQAEFPDNMSGKLTIHAAAGQPWQRLVRIPKGEPDNFMTDGELRAKFTALAAPILGQDRADRLAGHTISLDAAPNLGPLTRLASPTIGARLAGD